MASKPRLSGGPILLIEDNPDIRDTLSEFLSMEGHSVFAAADGTQALRMLGTRTIPRPCLILLDWVMQPMSGQRFLDEIQHRPDADQLRVLVVTGETNVDPGSSVAILGVLQKPFDLDTLLALLGKHCDGSAP
jgi:Response regulator containing CheY-like receiver, AAA-type ATPase, and DNA-binding domains